MIYMRSRRLVLAAVFCLALIPLAPPVWAAQANISDVAGQLAEQIVPKLKGRTGTVVQVSGTTAYTDLGQAAGVRAGQVFSVFRLGAEIKGVTGETLGQERKEIGTIKLTSLQEKMAVAEVVSSTQPIQRGDRVEEQKPELRVAVLQFSADAGMTRIDSHEIVGPLQELLNSALLKLQPSLILVEKTQLATVVDNLKSESGSGMYDDATAAKLGKLTGSNIVVTGKILEDGDNLVFSCHVVNAESGILLATPRITQAIVKEDVQKDARATQEDRVTDKGGVTAEERAKSKDLWERGKDLAETKSYALALNLFKDSWKVMPSAECANNIGEVYLEGNQLQMAARWFQAALKLAPDFRPAKVNMQIARDRWKKGKSRPAE